MTGLVVNAGASSVNEIATLQFATWQFLDDASLLAVSASSVTWGIVSGPITGIDDQAVIGSRATKDRTRRIVHLAAMMPPEPALLKNRGAIERRDETAPDARFSALLDARRT